MGGRTVSVVLACWRPTLRGVWRQVLSLALTVFSLVRRRRRELALLKALGC